MPKPIDSTHYFYRMRVGTATTHEGLYYYNGAFQVGTLDANTNERWKLFGNKLMNVGANAYIGGNTGTATLVSSSSATELTFVTGAYSDTHYVKAPNGYYLNWYNGNLVWQTTARTSWRFELLLRYISIPSMNVDYFSTKCGSTAGGTWPSSWTTKVRNLYKAVFGVATCTDSRAFVNLYGAMYGSTSYAGKFHTGIDMTSSVTSGANAGKIFSPIAGEVVNSGGSYGLVVIKYNNTYNYLFAHMSNIQVGVGDNVVVGQYIGKQSNVGPGVVDSHLHFEVTKGTNIAAIPSGSWENIGQTVAPYNYI